VEAFFILGFQVTDRETQLNAAWMGAGQHGERHPRSSGLENSQNKSTKPIAACQCVREEISGGRNSAIGFSNIPRSDQGTP
jgi:hypothetical protein